jgi:eukaryotic-like serine/threonine-protein kinase
VVIIDDAQWSDLDSLELLTELLRPPEAPPLMLVLTVRTGIGLSHDSPELRGRALAEMLLGKVRRIQVGPLPEEDAALLATQLLERSGVDNPGLALWSVRQAGGHPLFIDMLMRRADVASGAVAGELQLEEVLWDIIQKLDDAPRAVLENVAVAAAPLAQDVVRRATSLTGELFLKAVSLLRVSHLVQTSGARGADRLEPYHDRVRAAVLAHLDQARRSECHRRIAVALETSGHQDAEALSLHWQGAGDTQQAAHYAALAGDRAAEALAFDQAADFYEQALAKGDAAPPERRELLVKLARVLESAGHGEKAAHAYLEAAEGAPALQRADLERAASVELLSSGRLADGAAVLHRVLAAIGFKAPRTLLGVLFWLFIYRAWLAVRGLRFKERSPDEVRRQDRARVDALFAAAMGFAVSDAILSACVNLRHLIAALRGGDRFQVLRATCLQVAGLATAGGTPGKLERALSAIAAQLAEREESTEGRAYFDGCHGVALYLRGRWKDALRTLDDSLSKQLTHSHRAGWQSNAHVFGCWALRYMGEHAELARRHARLLVDADRRGDLYTSVQLRDGSLALVWLADDNPEEARRHAREAMAQWPNARYLTQHWHLMSGEAEIDLYVGEASRAYARIEKDRVALNRSLIGKVQNLRAFTAFLRGRCAISIAKSDPALQKTRLSEARTLARRIHKEKMAWTVPLEAILTAGVASVQGDDTGAAASLRIAIESAEAADMRGYAHAARYQLGRVIGGSQGESLVRQASEAMSAEGIRAPARFAQMMVPGNWKAEPQVMKEAPGAGL